MCLKRNYYSSTNTTSLVKVNPTLVLLKITRHITKVGIESHPCLPLSRSSTAEVKIVIVKFVNRKHAEAVLHSKKKVNSQREVFITVLHCHHYHFYLGDIGGNTKERQSLSKFLTWSSC